MNWTRETLLQPSLRGSASQAPYSGTLVFLSAFFGGPLAALAAFALNVQRLRRWPQDGAPLLIALLLSIALLAFMQGQSWQGQVGLRALALVLALAGLWRHRLEQNTAELLDSPRPKGFLVGLGLVVAGNLLLPMLEGLLR